MRLALASFVPVLALVGCGGGTAPTGGSGADMAAAPPGADLAQPASSTDMAGSLAPQSFSLGSFTLGPGDEKINCYYVPPDGTERYISRFTVDMNKGSHHLVVFRINDPVGDYDVYFKLPGSPQTSGVLKRRDP